MHYLILLSILLFGVADVQGSDFLDRMEYSVMLRGTYDNNVLRYSALDRSRALDGTEKYQTPNTTLDDLRSDMRFTAIYRFKMFGKRKGRIQSSVNLASYMNSQLNNAKWVSFTYKQSVHKRVSILYNYFYEPKYFIRDYFDVHTSTRHHADFALAKTVVKIYYRPIKLVEFIGSGEFKRYAYNKYFTEYDGDRIGFGGECIYRSKPWRATLSYGFGVFDNTGFVENNSNISIGWFEDTETGEGDYQEDVYGSSLEYSHRIFSKRSRTKFKLTIADRHYQTDRLPSIDPIHHARRDIVISTTITSTLKVTKQIDLKLGTSLINRDSEGSDSVVQRAKSYTRLLGWIEVSYEL